MDPKGKNYMEHKRVNNDRLTVYDAEIIDEKENEAEVVPIREKFPEKKLAYRLGKTAGIIFAGLGFLNEFRHLFRSGYTGGSSGSGRGMGMGKGKRRRKCKPRRFT